MATDIKKMMDGYLLAWNSHDVKKILSYFTDNCIYEEVAFGIVNHGKEGLNAYLTSMFVDFSNFKIVAKSVLGDHDWASIEWIISANHAHSNVPALPATGKPFSVNGAWICQLRNGRISRKLVYWDMVAFLQQVGFMLAVDFKAVWLSSIAVKSAPPILPKSRQRIWGWLLVSQLML